MRKIIKRLLPAVGAVVVVGLVVAAMLWPDHRAKIRLVLPARLNPGTTVSVPLTVSVDRAINAGEFYFDFPPKFLAVKEIQQTASIYQIWVKNSPGFDNTLGTIYLAGGLPNPGFSGQNGLVARVVFIVKAPGSGQITLEPKSRVLLNDGFGTAIPLNWQPVSFTARP